MKTNYYLFNPGRLSRRDNTLKFTPVDKEGKDLTPRYLPVEQVDSLFVFGSLDANSALYNFLGKNNITVHFFDYYENYTGSFAPKNGILSGRMLIAQTKAYTNKKHRLYIAKQFIIGAAYNILKNLKYYKNRGRVLEDYINKIEEFYNIIEDVDSVKELMGIEGNIRKIYYRAFEEIIKDYNMEGRSMQPPENIVNCLISFGNMVCYADCFRSISQTQLDATISYLHEPGERRYSLTLDISEVFKPLLVDRVIFKVLNKGILNKNDFDSKVNKILLKDNGRKKFLQAYDEHLKTTFKHRSLNRPVSYKHLIKLECYKLQKDLLNLDEYKSFKMYW